MGLLDGKLEGAAALIDLFGANAKLRRFRDGDYDPDTQTKDVREAFGSPHSLKIVWSGYLAGIAKLDLLQSGVIKPGTRRGYVKNSGLPFDPEAGDIIEFADRRDASKPATQFRVINVDPIVTGDDVVAWDLQMEI